MTHSQTVSFEPIKPGQSLTREWVNDNVGKLVAALNSVYPDQIGQIDVSRVADAASKKGGAWTGDYILSENGSINGIDPKDLLARINRISGLRERTVTRRYGVTYTQSPVLPTKDLPLAPGDDETNGDDDLIKTIATFQPPPGCDWKDCLFGWKLNKVRIPIWIDSSYNIPGHATDRRGLRPVTHINSDGDNQLKNAVLWNVTDGNSTWSGVTFDYGLIWILTHVGTTSTIVLTTGPGVPVASGTRTGPGRIHIEPVGTSGMYGEIDLVKQSSNDTGTLSISAYNDADPMSDVTGAESGNRSRRYYALWADATAQQVGMLNTDTYWPLSPSYKTGSPQELILPLLHRYGGLDFDAGDNRMYASMGRPPSKAADGGPWPQDMKHFTLPCYAIDRKSMFRSQEQAGTIRESYTCWPMGQLWPRGPDLSQLRVRFRPRLDGGSLSVDLQLGFVIRRPEDDYKNIVNSENVVVPFRFGTTSTIGYSGGYRSLDVDEDGTDEVFLNSKYMPDEVDCYKAGSNWEKELLSKLHPIDLERSAGDRQTMTAFSELFAYENDGFLTGPIEIDLTLNAIFYKRGL